VRVTLEPAYVLHRRPYRETSLLLEAFTRTHGRVGLVARGVRARRSRFTGLLEPFSPLLLSWAGRGELASLVAAEPGGAGARLGGRVLLNGLYANELLMRLLVRADPHPELFGSYRELLAELATRAGPEAPLRIFEKRLLAAIGYGLVTDREADTGAPIAAGKRYLYVLERGPLPAGVADAGVEIGGETLLALAAEHLSSKSELGEAKRLMRFVLGAYLGPRPLATRALYARPL